jgi:hypothetical protein
MHVGRLRRPSLDTIGEHDDRVADTHLCVPQASGLIWKATQLRRAKYVFEEIDGAGCAINNQVRRRRGVVRRLV